MAQSTKVALYNQSDLKNTTDDIIPNYLNSLNFKQIHFLTDVRLALGYGSFALACLCFGWDYYFGFENTKQYTLAAVLSYMLLNYSMIKWQNDMERGQVYLGTAPDGKKEISIATKGQKFTAEYTLEIAITDVINDPSLKKAPEPQLIKLNRSFTEWFDESGQFVVKPFQEMLATNVPLIAKYDPKRVKTSSQDLLNSNPELLDALLTGEATGAESVEAKGSKKRRG